MLIWIFSLFWVFIIGKILGMVVTVVVILSFYSAGLLVYPRLLLNRIHCIKQVPNSLKTTNLNIFVMKEADPEYLHLKTLSGKCTLILSQKGLHTMTEDSFLKLVDKHRKMTKYFTGTMLCFHQFLHFILYQQILQLKSAFKNPMTPIKLLSIMILLPWILPSIIKSIFGLSSTYPAK